ncbi:hypothetical protein, partial [Pseudonocardia sp.]|uniref:hypothetical protein n=1 Tax=Pseudonocardia sp. TaxID=60912 RepID=UPI0031FD7BFF
MLVFTHRCVKLRKSTFRIRQTAGRSSAGGMPPELDQPSPAGVQFQPELCEPIAELSQKPLRIFLMLEASGKIVRALEAWEQYERASHDRKQVTFSRGLHR